MTKKRVLYISPNGYLGGAEQVVYNAVNEHSKRDNLLAEIFFFNNGPFVDKCSEKKLPYHLLPFTFRLRNPFQLIRAIIYIRSYIKSNNFQIIHATMPYSFIVIYFAVLFLDVKLVWFQHGPVGGILDYIANFLTPDLIFFNSNFLQNEHLKMPFANRHLHKHRIINLGIPDIQINIEQVNQIKNNYKKDGILLLSAGRITPAKGYETIIKAIYSLNKKNNLHLLIIGDCTLPKDKPYAQMIKKLVKDYDLTDYISFIERVDNLHNYMNACDIYIQATKVPESFGLAVAESMLQNCLVIGPDFGGVCEILKHNKTGISFPSGHENAYIKLNEILKDIISSKNLRLDLQECAQSLIKNEYSLAQMINTFEKIYTLSNSHLL